MGEQMTSERWQDIPGYEGFYQASSLGRIKSVHRIIDSVSRNGNRYKKSVQERIMSGGKNSWGHAMIILCREGITKPHLIHRLVLKTFIGPCPNGMQSRHFPDDNKANNCLDNLQWGTPKENGADKIVHGTSGKGRPVSQETKAAISRSLKARRRDGP